MDKTMFEEIMKKKAESIYHAKKQECFGLMQRFLEANRYMNNHSFGNSLLIELENGINKIFESRRVDIIGEIEKIEINKVFADLNNVQFLFTPPPEEQK